MPIGIREGEQFNGYSHLIGAVLAVPAAIYLIERMQRQGGWLAAVAAISFTLAVLSMYSSSTMFHCSEGRARLRWQKCDHAAVHLLIAGTYTPFALLSLHGLEVWTGMIVIWSMAGWGIVREWRAYADATPSLRFYVVTGWLTVLATIPIAIRVGSPCLAWLVAGALIYTAGVLFYRRGARSPHAHGIWHLFVLAGTTSHFISVGSLVA